jgi:hypothetical protein
MSILSSNRGVCENAGMEEWYTVEETTVIGGRDSEEVRDTCMCDRRGTGKP